MFCKYLLKTNLLSVIDISYLMMYLFIKQTRRSNQASDIMLSQSCNILGEALPVAPSGLRSSQQQRSFISNWFLRLQVDVSDPRFQAVFTSHLFNLDPSHPSFRKTKATQSILEEKQRRREEAQKAPPTLEQEAEPSREQEAAERKQETDSVMETKAMDPSLSLLVKSIKSKTEQFQARKKRKVT